MSRVEIKCYEEIKTYWGVPGFWNDLSVEWIDVNGINTPYRVTIINKEMNDDK